MSMFYECPHVLMCGSELECLGRRARVVQTGARSHLPVCGDVKAGQMLVICDCGCLRQHDRPHAYAAPQPSSNPPEPKR